MSDALPNTEKLSRVPYSEQATPAHLGMALKKKKKDRPQASEGLLPDPHGITLHHRPLRTARPYPPHCPGIALCREPPRSDCCTFFLMLLRRGRFSCHICTRLHAPDFMRFYSSDTTTVHNLLSKQRQKSTIRRWLTCFVFVRAWHRITLCSNMASPHMCTMASANIHNCWKTQRVGSFKEHF